MCQLTGAGSKEAFLQHLSRYERSVGFGLALLVAFERSVAS